MTRRERHRLAGWLFWLADHQKTGIALFIVIVAVYALVLCIP